MIDVPENEKSLPLPPWMWVWFVLYICTLPTQIEVIKDFPNILIPIMFIFLVVLLIKYYIKHDDLVKHYIETQEKIEKHASFCIVVFSSLIAFWCISDLNATYWIPIMLMFLSVLNVFCPSLRQFYMETRDDLKENNSKMKPMIQIEDFIKLHAPGLRIKANLDQENGVFIYPIGYRQVCIAIFSDTIAKWMKDKEKTKAILLHEIGHYKNGDALILGGGSLLIHMLNIITPIYIILTLVTLIGIILSHSSLGFIFSFFNGMNDYVVSFMTTLALCTLPIIGIWCAELNADRHMVMSSNVKDSLAALEILEKKKPYKRIHPPSLTHPPVSLRRWMVRHSNEEKSILLYLFLFPLGYVLQFFMFVIYMFFSYFVIFLSGESNMQEFLLFLENIRSYTDTISFTWVLLPIVVILWPVLATHVVKFFTGLHETYNCKNYKTYFLTTLVLLCVFVLLPYV